MVELTSDLNRLVRVICLVLWVTLNNFFVVNQSRYLILHKHLLGIIFKLFKNFKFLIYWLLLDCHNILDLIGFQRLLISQRLFGLLFRGVHGVSHLILVVLVHDVVFESLELINVGLLDVFSNILDLRQILALSDLVEKFLLFDFSL